MEVLSVFALSLIAVANSISFDVPAISTAHVVEQPTVAPQLPESRFVEVGFDVTTMIPSTFHGNVHEIVVEVRSKHEDVQVADYLPKTETYSSIQGPIRRTTNYTQERDASVQANGFYPVFASAQGQASFRDHSVQTIEQEEIAAQKMLTAAGTLDRRTGVYFKLRANPQGVIEGAKHFSLLFEVPALWRGDLLEVRTFAFGINPQPFSPKSEQLLVSQRFHMAVYQVGDEGAAQRAIEFARQHVRLQSEADRYAQEIQHRANPTPLHQIGSALNLMKPQISNDWLNEWVFGTAYQKPAASMPVNLKVAMLDFQEARTAVLELAHELSVAAQFANHVSYVPANKSSAAFRTR